MSEYLTSTEAISRCLYQILKGYGFYVRWNKSDRSESFYLKINLVTREAPNALHIRISNHSVPRHKKSVRYDYDICASRDRAGAISYVKFLFHFAQQHGIALPRRIQALQPGTASYKNYTLALQQRAAA